jgi:Arc/MetJ-type ribon-helix-helix transcriptional regulator
MTKVAKITVSLPPEQVEQARDAVERGEASSVSAYVSAALAAVAPSISSDEEDTLADLVADMIAEDGVPSPEAYAWADEVMRSALRD